MPIEFVMNNFIYKTKFGNEYHPPLNILRFKISNFFSKNRLSIPMNKAKKVIKFNNLPTTNLDLDKRLLKENL